MCLPLRVFHDLSPTQSRQKEGRELHQASGESLEEVWYTECAYGVVSSRSGRTCGRLTAKPRNLSLQNQAHQGGKIRKGQEYHHLQYKKRLPPAFKKAWCLDLDDWKRRDVEA